MNKPIFIYADTEIEYLKSKDKPLSYAINIIGHINRKVIPDLYMALINSIIAQQISAKAVDTIWNRLLLLADPFIPENIAKFSLDDIQKCGTTMKKANYIKDVSLNIINGKLDLNILKSLSDKEVCDTLVSIKGIGIWTAEMLMIFSMQRSNIFSYGDLAIHRGLRMLYGHKIITPKLFEKYRKRFSPYGSVASLYLWAIAGGAIPELREKSKNDSIILENTIK